MRNLIITALLCTFCTACTPSFYYGSIKDYNCNKAPYPELQRSLAGCRSKDAIKVYLETTDRGKANKAAIHCNDLIKAAICNLEDKFFARKGSRAQGMLDCAEAYNDKAKQACANVGYNYGNRKGRK